MSVLLSNPDYLLEGFAEKRCKYIGVLENIPTTLDLNDRNFLLNILDSSRNSGKLPWKLGLDDEVTVTISALNLKIIKEDRTGTVLHRLPIHEVASCVYVNDDDQHLLFLRAGDSDHAHCPVHVVMVNRRADAEEVCGILREVFQLVYTEATIRQLNDSITAGERGSMAATATQQTPSGGVKSDARRQLQLSGDGQNEEEEEEEEEDGATAEELVQHYMERLHKLLDLKELRDFASLLKRYRDDLPVTQFLTRLKRLYGSQRSFLIPGMRSFIPEEDRAEFEEFLVENNLPTDQPHPPALSAVTKPHPPALSAVTKTHPPPLSAVTKPHPPPATQVVSQSSGGEGERGRRGRNRRTSGARVADMDKFLADIDSHAEAMMDTSNF
ncbi:Cerebral cavernous malformations protein 2 homolog [Geodia barretti]|nr:Cerebral cavernous malformations protein 2 homolog [Geodia barretti]